MKTAIIAVAAAVVFTSAASAQVKGAPPPQKRDGHVSHPTDPGTPPLVAAGPDAEKLGREALSAGAAAKDPSANPTEGAPGANPPVDVEGNFLVGPVYKPAPELKVLPGVPHGRIQQFTVSSADSKFFPGINRRERGTPDPNNPKTLIVDTFAQPYTRMITVYVPAEYAAGTAAPFIVVHDGPSTSNVDMMLPHVLDNMIAQHRVPAMLAIMIANRRGDAQGWHHALE